MDKEEIILLKIIHLQILNTYYSSEFPIPYL